MSIEAKDIQVFILAGGHSSRMGTDKGFLIWNGRTFVEQILAELQTLGQEVTLVSNQPEKYSAYGCVILRDSIQEIGPLGGLYTGLLHAKKDLNLFVSCDSPMLSGSFYRDFLANAKSDCINYSKIGDRLHPLPVLLHKDVLGKMKESIDENNYKLIHFYEQFNSNLIDMSVYESEMKNINTPEEYKALISQK